jgi:hypothetical protein
VPRRRALLSALLATIAVAALSWATPRRQERAEGPKEPVLAVPRASSPITIDAILDEPAWQHALVIPVDIEIQPGDNIPAPVRTTCLIAYDPHTLYVAFHAYDPHPAAIRAHLTDRDNAGRDDFVGLFLDTFNDQRRGYELFVNPVNVQMDLSRNEVGAGGDPEDASWDAIWHSAARITTDGCIVEMAIPLSSLRFPRMEGAQTWGILPFRIYPRSVRHQISSHRLARDNNCLMCQFIKVTGLEGLVPGHDLEFDPTLTAQKTDALSDEDDLHSPWVKGGVHTELGVSARWGVTPNLSLNAAVNPDFSQVEADVAQLDVNNRFVLFYPEKRPFFMEGADFFTTPFRIVNTRAVVDPSWGVKLTGKPGPQAVGVFAARDDVTSLVLPSNQGSDTTTLAQGNTAGVFRYRRDIGKSSTLGVLATSREGDGYSNRVMGLDGVFRISSTDYVDMQLLRSQTRYPSEVVTGYDQPSGSFGGSALHLYYEHDETNWNAWAWVEDLGRGFRADLGFIPRADTRTREGGAQYIFWGKEDDWYSRIALAAKFNRTTDHNGMLTDQQAVAALSYQGPWQSTVNLHLIRAKEFYEGVTYDESQAKLFVNVRVNGTFTCDIDTQFGDTVDYDNGRPARILHLDPGFTLDLGRHVGVTFDHLFEQLDVAGGRLYRANLTQVKVVYQFTVRTFVRAIAQVLDVTRNPALYLDEEEPYTDTLFGQFLFSYKINPQTVLFVGYSDNRLAQQGLGLTRTNRTLFAKIGYAWLM